MDILLVPFLNVLYVVLSMSSWFICIHIVLSWLLLFGILNIRNNFVFSFVSFFSRFSEIFASPLRRFLPIMAGLDLPLLAALLLIYFVQGVIGRILLRFAFI